MSVNPRSQRGFTMIEMITVVAVLGIMMVAIGPRFFNMTAFRARGYADELAAAMRYAQRIAMTSSCNVRFTVTTTSYNAFQRSSKANCTSSGSWNREVLLPTGDDLTGTAPSGVTATAATIEFNSSGALVGTVTPVAIGAFSVAIDPVIGRVTVQ